MPKQLIEIRDFRYGIMSAPSETDIPLSAAAYSLNIDPTIEDGKLGAVPMDETIIASFPGTQIEWIEETGGAKERSLFYYDPLASSFNYYIDFYGDRLGPFAIPTSVTPDGQIISPVQQGHALHIGMGNSQSAKWVGYVQHDQFGVAPTTNLVMYDAALESYSIVVNGIYRSLYFINHVAIEYGSNKIVVISPSGSIIHTSEDDGIVFEKLQAICMSRTSGDYLWVYDNDSTANGTLYELSFDINTYEFAIVKTITIASWGSGGLEDPSAYICTDIVQGDGTTKDIWFAFHNIAGGVKVTKKRSQDPTNIKPVDADLAAGYGTLLFKSSGVPADLASITPTNMTINLKGTDEDGKKPGKFYLEGSVDDSYHYFNLITLMKPLVAIPSSDNVAWFCTFSSGTSTPKMSLSDAGHWAYIALGAYIVSPLMVAGESARPINTGTGTSTLNYRAAQLENDVGEAQSSFYGKSIRNFHAEVFNGDDPYTNWFLCLSIGNGISTTVYSYDDGELAMTSNDNFIGVGALRYFASDTIISGHNYPADSSSIGLPSATIGGGTSGIVNIFMQDGGFGIASMTLADDGDLGDATYISASDFIVVARDTDARADGMRKDRTYRYFFAYEYDNFQVGPISGVLCEHAPAEDGKAVFIDFYFLAAEVPNPRVSGLIVLRSYYDGLISTQEDSLPRVIGRIDITNLTTTKKLEGFSTDYYFYTVKDTNQPSETFEELAGYGHTETQCTPNYGLSCSGGGVLFMTDCGGVTGLDDTSNYGFFSEVGRYDQVDLSNKFVIFNEKPTAVAYYHGTFYAFASSKFWRIDPSGPMIVDEFDGIGCEGRDCVFVSEYGLFVAGTNNIYIEMGTGFKAIGDPILTSSDGVSGYQQRDTTDPPLVLFDMKRKSFLVFFTDGDSNARCYAFNVDRARWDLWAAPSGVCDGLIGESGEMVVTNAAGLYSYLGSTEQRRTYTWYSKVLDANMNTIDKKWYKVSVPFEGISNPTPVSVKDHSGDSVTTTDESISGMIIRSMSDVRKRGLQVRIDDMNGTASIDSIGVIYRPFIGVR